MKRGQSGISCIVGVDKPQGMSSHDVVNACRRIFGERRVGHTGTLDPLATGALCVCVGPAARLDAYMTNHDKTYDVRIAFGVATDTDDAAGEPVHICDVPSCVCDVEFARDYVASLIGRHKQLPPAYSAIKRDGVKAYEAARAGNVVKLEPRDIEIYDAVLLDLERDHDADVLYWDVRLSVSKGTYIRSIARDTGRALKTAAHVAKLRRLQAGALDVTDCLSLEALEQRGLDAAIDPVFLLGYRMAFLDEGQAAAVRNGAFLPTAALTLFDAPRRFDDADCGPMRGAHKSDAPLADGEVISLVFGNELVALYTIRLKQGDARPCCVFSQGVIRGKGL
ncbi:MAG: tRNA pseudouridine(55) synthase TruB [Slackia sp.]|nr:tRNA pseudouridine(55) synthase TruB [Slackia sp.]